MVSLGVIALTVAALMIRPNRATIRIARAVALLTIVVSALGFWWEVADGRSAMCQYSRPGALAPVGIALALGTIGLEDRVERLAAGTLKLYDYLLADPLWVDITIIGRTIHETSR